MRGEFRFADGLILPNNISLAGAKAILDSAFRLQAQTWFAALVSGPPTLDMVQGDLSEPTIGINGYARVALPHNSTGWPTVSDVNGQAYVESAQITFEATGGDFSAPYQRLALVLTETRSLSGVVVALSAPLPFERVVTPATPLVERQFTYRVYL